MDSQPLNKYYKQDMCLLDSYNEMNFTMNTIYLLKDLTMRDDENKEMMSSILTTRVMYVYLLYIFITSI